MLTFGERVLQYYGQLKPPRVIPRGFKAIIPTNGQVVNDYMQLFYRKYYSNKQKRVFVLGINPGRFGSGVTGIPFTDPIALEEICGINNTIAKRRELTSQFIYEFIKQWGGPHKIYNDFFFTSVCPIGFENNGVNRNYYDKALLPTIRPYLVNALGKQCSLGAENVAIVLGTGDNQKNFNRINEENSFFSSFHALEHPRFIMQYRRQHKCEYLERYHHIFKLALIENCR